MRAQSTILGLMGAVAFIAFGMAALRPDNATWAAVILALTVVVLCVATQVTLYHRGAWAGLAVFGWAAFLICQPHSAPTVGLAPAPTVLVCRLLIPSGPTVQNWSVLDSLGNLLFERGVTTNRMQNASPPSTPGITGYTAILTDGMGRPFLAFVSNSGARDIGYVPIHRLRVTLCLVCLISGFIGAILGGFIERRSGPRRDPGDCIRSA
jgi:hypothetical protein